MSRPQREPYREGRSLPQFTRDLHPAAVQPHELLYECESDARAFVGTAVRSLDAVKALEEPRQLVPGYSDAGVADIQPGASCFLAQTYRDAALKRELKGVRQQVENDLLPHFPI